MKRIDYQKGQVIGDYGVTYVEEIETNIQPNSGKYRRAKFICPRCGKEFITRISSVKNNSTKSCGCLHIEIIKQIGNDNKYITKHGYARHSKKRKPEYQCWIAVKGRCCNINNKDYKHYGGRGVIVCDRWLESFENFIADMGNKPSPQHSIDRIDNDGNYEPSNCRWATYSEQNANRRKYNKKSTF